MCLSLMLGMAVGESTHNHATQAEAASCSICVAAHSASPSVSSVQAIPLFAAVDLLREKDEVAKIRFDFCEAGIRGPPAVL
jgi:hypothetical protein